MFRLDFQTGRQKFMAAALAFQPEIHADAQDEKGFGAAGMRFFHFQQVAYPYIHRATFFLYFLKS